MTPDALWNMNGLGAGMISGAILLAGSACGIILWNKRVEKPLVPALLVLILLPGAVFLYGTEMMDFRTALRAVIACIVSGLVPGGVMGLVVPQDCPNYPVPINDDCLGGERYSYSLQ